MFLKIIRYFIGYISFTVTGNSIERFFNLIARSGITVWNIKNSYKNKDSLNNCKRCYTSAEVIASEYKLLKPMAKKSGLNIKTIKKSGIPFIINKYKKRLGIFIGIATMCAVIYILSLYIWVVNVEGNLELSSEEVKSVVSELGLKPGILKKYVDIKKIEHETMSHFNSLSWISLNIEGCFATISINESLKPPEIIPKNQPCNIKAKRAGQIIRMEVYKGNQEVKNGDAVIEGQLLVSGIVEDTFGGNSINHASAKAIAATKHELQQKVCFNATEKIHTGKKVLKRRLHVFGLDIPVTLQTNPDGIFETFIKTDVLKIFGVPLPISIYKEDWIEQAEKTKKLSLEETKEIAYKEISQTKQIYFENKKIIREDILENITNEAYFLNITVYCEEDIAVEGPLELLTG